MAFDISSRCGRFALNVFLFACSGLSHYFRHVKGNPQDFVPSTFTFDLTVISNTSGGEDGGVTKGATPLEVLQSDEGWQSFTRRYALLKEKRFVQESMPFKQCLYNAWVVKHDTRDHGDMIVRSFDGIRCLRGNVTWCVSPSGADIHVTCKVTEVFGELWAGEADGTEVHRTPVLVAAAKV